MTKMTIYKFTKRNIRMMFIRILEDCDKCPDKEGVKINILAESRWLGFRIKGAKNENS